MKFVQFVISSFLISICALAQEFDSLKTLQRDTLITAEGDTIITSKQDTAATKKSDIDTVVNASASDSLIFFVKEKKMAVYGDAQLNYRTTDVKSANIFLDFEKFEIEAVGVPKDSSTKELKGTPVLTEAGEVYEGKRMKYNFKTGRGSLSAVDTELEGGFYHGEKIKKVTKDTYFIKDGTYTTCDADTPHYYFYSPKMKVINREQLVAEWIWLHFGDVPLPLPLPFAVIPLQSGRRSGIIAPVLGSTGQYGTYIGRFGYFWAISDYMDINFVADYYTRGSYTLNSRFRYAKRYSYSGNIEGSYKDFTIGETTDPNFSENIQWRVRWLHNQTITPTLRLDAQLEFASQNFLQVGTTNLNDALRNQIISDATLSKTWEESGNSASINYHREQQLQDNRISERLPSILFRKAQDYPFRSSSGAKDNAWYSSFGYSYTGQFQNSRNKVAGNLDIRGGFQHNIDASISPKIGFFSFAPRVSYQERWYNKQIEQYSIESSTGKDSIITNDLKKVDFVRTFDAGINASTKFYGMFNINSMGINAIRQTVSPSISYVYHPDFSEPQWGYFGTYTNTKGQVVKYSKFSKEVFGGAPSGESQSINFSLGNNFEMKTIKDPTDTTSKEDKIQLLNLTMGMGYNFVADSLNFSDLNVSARTQVGEFFDFSGSSQFTLYDYAYVPDDVSQTQQRINKFLYDEGKGLFRLTSLNFSISTRLSGEKLKDDGKEGARQDTTDEFGIKDTEDRNIYKGIYDNKDPDFTIPWQISLSYTFNLSRQIPELSRTRHSLNGSISFNLTKNWKFDITGSYDFETNEFVAPQIRVSRDLHCWLMNFTWNPIGTYSGYRFEIRVKAPQLQDLKVTKQDQFYETR